MNQLSELNPVPVVEAQLPSDWRSGELLDFLELQRGVDLPVQDRRAGSVPIFGSNGLLGYHDASVSEGPGVITGRSGTIGKVFYSDGMYWPLNTSLYVKDFKGNLPKFVYYKLDAIGLERFSTGTGVPTLNRNVAHKEPVAFPPLSEQQKIAAILTAVDDKLDVIALQIEATQTLKQGLMQTLFSRGVGTQDADGRWVPHTEFKDSELGEIPMGWEAIKLGSLVRSYAGGTPGRSNPDYFGGDVPWVKSGEVNRKTITYTEESITQLAVEKTSARVAEKGAILVAMYGATAGKVSRLMLDAAINQAILSIRSVSEKITNDFLYWLICNQTERMLAMCQGAAQPNLSKGLIESILLAVPDLHEQRQISKTLYAMEDKIDALADKHGQYQSLKRGLMQKLLTGEWRVKVDVELTA